MNDDGMPGDKELQTRLAACLGVSEQLELLKDVRRRAFMAGMEQGRQSQQRSATSSVNVRDDYRFEVSGSETFVRECMNAYIATIDRWTRED